MNFPMNYYFIRDTLTFSIWSKIVAMRTNPTLFTIYDLFNDDTARNKIVKNLKNEYLGLSHFHQLNR